MPSPFIVSQRSQAQVSDQTELWTRKSQCNKSAFSPSGSDSRPACNVWRTEFNPIRRSWEGMATHPVYSPWSILRNREVSSYSPHGVLKDLDTTERPTPSLSLFTSKAGCENTLLATHKLRESLEVLTSNRVARTGETHSLSGSANSRLSLKRDNSGW